MHEARYYIKQEEGKVRCGLCPHQCSLAPDETGLCRYFPAWHFSNPPTPADTLRNMKTIAGKYLTHIYLGNVG